MREPVRDKGRLEHILSAISNIEEFTKTALRMQINQAVPLKSVYGPFCQADDCTFAYHVFLLVRVTGVETAGRKSHQKGNVYVLTPRDQRLVKQAQDYNRKHHG